MFDWFVLLVPLAILPVVLLLAFVGCQLIWGVDPYYNEVPISLVISSGCTGLTSITYTFSNTVNDEVYNSVLTPVPPEKTTLSTGDLKIGIGDGGTVWCAVTIKPDQGESFDLPTAGHDKIEDELVEHFTFFCINGDFELS
jgi:hypothetical protein